MHANASLRWYAGVGSRQTPISVLNQVRLIAHRLAQRGFGLRSGAAIGADSAFESGALAAGGQTEIWLPWRGYNGHDSHHVVEHRDAFALAASAHPTWPRLSQGVRKLHARNAHQVFGPDLDDPVEFVLCFTADGAESEAERTEATGGTGLAITLANRHGIPIINLARPGALDRIGAIVTAPPVTRAPPSIPEPADRSRAQPRLFP